MQLEKQIEFDAQIADEDRLKFAELSDDWNPLHRYLEYAKNTEYESCTLHGDFLAEFLSRMAGIVHPSESYLLHGILVNLTKISARELAHKHIKVMGVSLEVIHTAMTLISQHIKSDRTLTGKLQLMVEVIDQIECVLNNPGKLISRSFIDLIGEAQP